MKRLGLLSLILALGVTAGRAGSLGTDFQYAVLDNGFRVVLVPRPSSSVVASIVVVGAGLRYETVETNGLSHFLEHLLFNGTEKRTQKELYDEMDLIGGYNNANTGPDYTNFMVLAPTEHISTALDIQADMLFHSTLPPGKLEKERGIVLREIDKDRDQPDAQADRLFKALLFEGTPYAWPILGPRELIASIPREPVYQYYKTYYVPNNMTALIIGNFDTFEMLKLVREKFGQVPPKTVPRLQPVQPRVPSQDRLFKRRFTTKQITLHLGALGGRPVLPDFYAYELATQLLASEEGDWSLSRFLHQRFGGAVVDVSVQYDFHPELTALQVQVTLDTSADVQAVWDATRDFLRKVGEKPISRRELDALRLTLRTAEVLDGERPHHLGILKAPYLAVFGPSILSDYWPGMDAVTPVGVQRAWRQWMAKAHFTGLAAGPLRAGGPSQVSGRKEPEMRVLPNGLTVIVQQDPGAPIFAAHVLVKGRLLMEPPGKDGISILLHELLPRGTRAHPGESFRRALDEIGARVQVTDSPWIPFDDYYTQPDFSFVRFECLDEYRQSGLGLLAEMLREPELSGKEFDRVKQQALGMAGMRSGTARERSRALFMRTLFAGHPFARAVYGTPRTLGSISIQDVRQFARGYLVPSNMILAVVTAGPADALWKEIQQRFGWQASGALKPEQKTWPKAVRGLKKVEDRKGSGRAYLRMGNILPEVPDADVPALLVANEILSSRIAFDLREKRGWAYSIGSSVALFGGKGWFSAAMNLAAQNLQAATDAIREHMRKLQRQPVQKAELERAVNQVRSRYAMRTLRRVNRAFYMSVDQYRTGQLDWTSRMVEGVSKVTAKDVARVSKYFTPDDLVIVWVD